LAPEQGAFDRFAIQVIAGQLELDHYLAVRLCLRPRRCQVPQQVGPADYEEAVTLDLLQSDLGWILPAGGASRDALGLFGERPLGEDLRVTHAPLIIIDLGCRRPALQAVKDRGQELRE